MDSCRIDTYYVKRGEPHSMYKDFFSLHPPNEFKRDGRNIWKGYYGQYIVTIVQKYRHHDTEAEDVTIEKDFSRKEDTDTLYNIPSKEELAKAFNKHLGRIYD